MAAAMNREPSRLARSPLQREGILYHGCDYEEWLRSVTVRLFRQYAPSNNPTGNSQSVALHIPARPTDAFDLMVVKSTIHKPLLERLPVTLLSDLDRLFEVLPRYSGSFRFMDLPTELRLLVYGTFDIDALLPITNALFKNFLRPWPRLLGVSTTIRKEALPYIVPKIRFWVDRPAGFSRNLFATDSVRYLSRFAITVSRRDGGTVLLLTLELGKAIERQINIRGNEIAIPASPNCSGEFLKALYTAICKYKLDVAMPGNRGEDLLALFEEIMELVGTETSNRKIL